MDIAKELPTVLSLCSGYGGIERGLDLAGFKHRVIAYVEIEAYAIANLANKMERGQLLPAPIWSNLKTLPVEPFRDRVDILTGGYPCQPFSAAGQRKGEEDERHLWPYILRIIKAVRPVRCFFENVEGHISLGLREVIADLEGIGYSTAWGIFSATEVGAPHQRKRVFIMADTNGAGQQAQRDKSRAERQAQVTCQSSELGDAANIRRKRRGATTELKRSANIQEQSESNLRGEFERSSQAVADSQGEFGQRGIAERVGSGKSQETIGDGGAFKSVADTIGKGSQRGLPRWSDTQREGEFRHSGRCSAVPQWGQDENWPTEPNVGRVVDGCADRVDRIRLLGNGVLPATAAKAWRVLNG